MLPMVKALDYFSSEEVERARRYHRPLYWSMLGDLVLGVGLLAVDIRALAERARVPVRDVLVADASRRTRKENAYVSGLGATRRVVVYDTLLQRGGPRQVRLVAAHELGHRRMRHVTQGTIVGM